MLQAYSPGLLSRFEPAAPVTTQIGTGMATSRGICVSRVPASLRLWLSAARSPLWGSCPWETVLGYKQWQPPLKVRNKLERKDDPWS